jgi:hypothetical protein
MCAARPSVAAIQDRQRAVPAIEAGKQVKPRSAAGAADRPSREGTPTAWPDVRVKPVAPPERWPRASTRPRWPVDAPITLKKANVFLHPPRCWRGEVGGGLFRRRLRHVVGHPRRVYEGPGRDALALRGRVSSNAQGNRGRPGPISDGRTPEKQAPAHLVASATPARAKRSTPALAKRLNATSRTVHGQQRKASTRPHACPAESNTCSPAGSASSAIRSPTRRRVCPDARETSSSPSAQRR